jgi:alkyl sulfatase BDS1-like metallo-beta-lactamase superfamily hydrolase
MNGHDDQHAAAPIFRINKFAVPSGSRSEFLGTLTRTHDVMRQHGGFVKALFLEQQISPDIVNIVAVIEFVDEAAADRVIAAIAADDRKTGLDRGAMAARLGITADMGRYRPVGSMSLGAGFPQ